MDGLSCFESMIGCEMIDQLSYVLNQKEKPEQLPRNVLFKEVVTPAPKTPVLATKLAARFTGVGSLKLSML